MVNFIKINSNHSIWIFFITEHRFVDWKIKVYSYQNQFDSIINTPSISFAYLARRIIVFITQDIYNRFILIFKLNRFTQFNSVLMCPILHSLHFPWYTYQIADFNIICYPYIGPNYGYQMMLQVHSGLEYFTEWNQIKAHQEQFSCHCLILFVVFSYLYSYQVYFYLSNISFTIIIFTHCLLAKLSYFVIYVMCNYLAFTFRIQVQQQQTTQILYSLFPFIWLLYLLPYFREWILHAFWFVDTSIQNKVLIPCIIDIYFSAN